MDYNLLTLQSKQKMMRIFIVILLIIAPYFAWSQNKIANPVTEVKGLFYTVQLGTFSSPEIPDQLIELNDLNVEILNDGKFRYSSGVFRELKFASSRKEELINAGFSGAFVIAYEDNNRISLRELRERQLQNQANNTISSKENNANSEPLLIELPKGTTGDRFNFELKSGTVLGEATREVSDLFENQILDYTYRKLKPDTNLISLLYSLNFDSIPLYVLDSTYIRSEINRAKKDIGLNFGASYLYNFTPGFGLEEDLFYRQRLTFGFEMDILRSGLYGNNLKAKQLENQLRINSIQSDAILKNSSYEDVYNFIIFTYNREKLEKIDERINLLKRQIQVIEMLYTTKEKSWEDLIELKSKISRSENMYKKWQTYNNALRENIQLTDEEINLINPAKLPILEIIPQKLFVSDNLFSSQKDELIDLEQKNIELRNKRMNDVTLRPFIRYNLITQDERANRNFSSAGVTFRMPIRFAGPTKSMKAEQEIRAYQIENEYSADNHELINYYYEYAFKLEQVFDFYHTRFKIEERLRREIIRYQFADPSFSPLRAIQYMDEILANEIEIIDLRQMLSLKLLRMNRYTKISSPMEYCKPVSPENLISKYDQKRYIYIWSKFFNNQDNLFLIHYLSINEIKKVFLSIGPNPNEKKIKDFIRLADKYNIQVNALIGNNKLALEFNETDLLNNLNSYVELGFRGIHYDIEPQTFPDWDGTKEFYLNNVSEVLRISRTFLTPLGLELETSIPLHYPEEFLPQIYENVDKVYLMAYERPDIEFIKRKSLEEFSLNKEKTILSLRTKDFPNRLVMEKFIEAITQEMDLNEITIHDLGTLFELDYSSTFIPEK